MSAAPRGDLTRELMALERLQPALSLRDPVHDSHADLVLPSLGSEMLLTMLVPDQSSDPKDYSNVAFLCASA